MNGQDIGLRERKRNETRDQLERAAITLVAEHGLDETTIDMICEVVNVSKRTFFNYFDSKEDAIVGLHERDMSNELLLAHASMYARCDAVEVVVALLFRIVGPSITDPLLYKTRLQVIRENPLLLERQMAHMIRATRQFSGAVQTVLQAHRQAPFSLEQAEMLLSLCGGGMRMAIREWATTNDTLSLPALEKRTIQLINEVIKKI